MKLRTAIATLTAALSIGFGASVWADCTGPACAAENIIPAQAKVETGPHRSAVVKNIIYPDDRTTILERQILNLTKRVEALERELKNTRRR